ncbi:MAG TPA: hypothetical protein PLP01_04560 [Phycisphaerae bacterium]|nr:hypothetical protein [Phycisphaerae bacterium]
MASSERSSIGTLICRIAEDVGMKVKPRNPAGRYINLSKPDNSRVAAQIHELPRRPEGCVLVVCSRDKGAASDCPFERVDDFEELRGHVGRNKLWLGRIGKTFRHLAPLKAFFVPDSTTNEAELRRLLERAVKDC